MRTIQTTPQVGGNQQQIINTAQPHIIHSATQQKNLQQQIINSTQPHMIGTSQQQVIRTLQHQPTTVGNTQVIHGAQPSAIRGTQPNMIQMTQLQPSDTKVGCLIYFIYLIIFIYVQLIKVRWVQDVPGSHKETNLCIARV